MNNFSVLNEDLGDARIREQKLFEALRDLIDEFEINTSSEALKNSPCFQRAKRTLNELCKSEAV